MDQTRSSVDSRPLPGWLTGLLVGGAFVGLLWLERWRPLRRSVEPKVRRNVRNMVVAGLSAAAIQIAEKPITQPLTARVERRHWGVIKQLALPVWLEAPLAVALLDYTLYLWHILTHQIPLLWRFHQPHHVDLDMDASTALRFHFGEMVLSVPWRAAQIVVIGVSPLALSLWQTLTLVEILFHHSNVELPIELERRLSCFIVTPRLHAIHHSIVSEETASNWSSGLTIWDWLHGTLRMDVPQDEIVIGVPAYRDPQEVALPHIVAMPFTQQRDRWRSPGDGQPSRRNLPITAEFRD